MTYYAKVISGGKIVLPAELRRELGIKDGDSLVIDRDESGGLVVKTYVQVIKEAQRKFRAMAGDDYTVEMFLQEKLADWAEN
jgi:AbrB family transcriptional regulator (stage V sporulation protein T)